MPPNKQMKRKTQRSWKWRSLKAKTWCYFLKKRSLGEMPIVELRKKQTRIIARDAAALKKRRMALGKIGFIFRTYTIDDSVYLDPIEIKFVNVFIPDAPMPFDERLKQYDWEWDARNITSFAVIAFWVCMFAVAKLRLWFRLKTAAWFASSIYWPSLVRFSFELTFNQPLSQVPLSWINVNYWIVSVLTDFCVYFNFIF